MTENVRKDIEALRSFLVDDCIDFPHVIHTALHKAADLIESLSAQLDQVTRERDAAVEDMKIIRSCRQCKTWQEYFKDNGDVSPCEDCDMYSNWQWRGVEVEDDQS